MRTLLLLRHASAVDIAPGRGDAARALSEAGIVQARAVGDHLRATGVAVDLVVCSSAVRTRETAEHLGLNAPIELDDRIYNAGSDTVLAEIGAVDDQVQTLLVVGHAPGIPALAHDLADPENSEEDALRAIDRDYPTATLCRFAVESSWADLRSARLIEAHLTRR